jgi:hypothetical protein
MKTDAYKPNVDFPKTVFGRFLNVLNPFRYLHWKGFFIAVSNFFRTVYSLRQTGTRSNMYVYVHVSHCVACFLVSPTVLAFLNTAICFDTYSGMEA